MGSLRCWRSRKDDPTWMRALSGKWEILLRNDGTFQNPWKEWCRSWQNDQPYFTKIPKSVKERVAIWSELYSLAKFTSDQFDDAMAKNQELIKQKAELTNLQQENLLLKRRCESLEKQLAYEQQAKIQDDQCHQKELEKEVRETQLAQEENKMLQVALWESNKQCKDLEQRSLDLNGQLVEKLDENLNFQWKNKRLEALIEGSLTKREELEDQISALEGQLVKAGEQKIVYNQYQKNVLIYCTCRNQFIDGGESWHEMAKRAGVGCPSREKILGRLERYEYLNSETYNATFWQLAIRLSRHEDLGKKRPL